MAKNPIWLAKQIRNSDKELSADVDSSEEQRQLSVMQDRHDREVQELRSNPTMALARITEQKVYFTAEELQLAYGRKMKPKADSAIVMTPESLTKYEEGQADREFWEDVSKIEGHWSHKR